MSVMNQTPRVSRLRQLHQRTIPGRWWRGEAPRPIRDIETYIIAGNNIIDASNDPNVGTVVCALKAAPMDSGSNASDDETLVQADTNGDFICAAKNDLPAVFETIDALTARVRELEIQGEVMSRARERAETRTMQFESALTGPDVDVPTVWRIAWLRMLLDECQRPDVRPVLDGADPVSSSMMIDQVQALFDDASAALSERQQIIDEAFRTNTAITNPGADRLNGR